MATGLKSRVIFKAHTTDGLWTGSYNFLLKAKSIPSPLGEKNMVDVSTLEDLMVVEEEGRRASTSVTIQGAMDKDYYQTLDALEGDKIDVIIAYGTDGKGSVLKLAFTGMASVSPDEASEDHLTMSVKIAVSTVPKDITDDVTITEVTDDNGNITGFTVAAAS